MKKFIAADFSKKIATVAGATTILVVAFAMFMIYRTNDLSALVTLIVSVFGITSVVVGFYFWKARLENSIKLRQKYGAEVFNDAKGGFDDGTNYSA